MLAAVSQRLHQVRISPLPTWLDAERLLGPELFTFRMLESGAREAYAELLAPAAAEVATRLRGLGIDGKPLEIAIKPPLARALVRAARLTEARARRDLTPGFVQRGVRLDEEGRFSLTPEALALELGRRAAGLRVVDVCCGSGGNSLGFARAGCQVTAIELDAARAADARHNAQLYGVADRVQIRVGDARAILPSIEADLAFIDPPWGRDYDKQATRLSDLPLLAEILPLCERFTQAWIKLPASFATQDLPGFAAEAIFGAASGDLRRIKLLLMTRTSTPRPPSTT